MKGLRPLTAELVQTMSLTMTGVTETFGILTGVEMAATFAVVMNPLAIGELRPAESVDCRQFAESQKINDGCCQVLGIERATGQVEIAAPGTGW